MTYLAEVEANALADFQASRITHLSLHTGYNMDETGAGECAGAPYARQPVTFTAAGAEGVMGVGNQPATIGVAWSDQVTFDVDAGSYTEWGAWTALTAGSFCLGNNLSSEQTPAGPGQILLSVACGQFYGA